MGARGVLGGHIADRALLDVSRTEGQHCGTLHKAPTCPSRPTADSSAEASLVHRRRRHALDLSCSSASAQGEKQVAIPAALSPDLDAARAALEKYQDPVLAVHDGYFSTVACVEYTKGGEGSMDYVPGGMGVHFINLQAIGPTLDPAKPQVLLYEPVGDKLASGRGGVVRADRYGRRDASRDLRSGAPGPDGGARAPAAEGPAPLRPARLALEEQSGRHVLADESGGQVPQGELLRSASTRRNEVVEAAGVRYSTVRSAPGAGGRAGRAPCSRGCRAATACAPAGHRLGSRGGSDGASTSTGGALRAADSLAGRFPARPQGPNQP